MFFRVGELLDEALAAVPQYRTDAVRVAAEALRAVRELIPQRFGTSFLPAEPRTYKAKKSAQEAHEAIRPTAPPSTIRRNRY